MSNSGFEAPNHTQIPNYIIDNWMRKLSHAEYKIITYIYRQTTGYHRREAYISFNDFETYCGVTHKWARTCVKKFENLKWIKIKHGNKTTANKYEILIRSDSKKSCKVVDTPDEDSNNLGRVVSTSGRVLSTSQGRVLSTLNKQSKKESKLKKGQCLDDVLPDKSKEKNFINALNPDQRKLHDEIVSFKPKWGVPPKSKDVCAWFLSGKKFTVSQVTAGFEVYKQDVEDAIKRGGEVRDMGAVIRTALDRGRRPRTPDAEFNKSHAQLLSKKHRWLNFTERYVTIDTISWKGDLYYTISKQEFVNKLDSIIRQQEYDRV